MNKSKEVAAKAPWSRDRAAPIPWFLQGAPNGAGWCSFGQAWAMGVCRSTRTVTAPNPLAQVTG